MSFKSFTKSISKSLTKAGKVLSKEIPKIREVKDVSKLIETLPKAVNPKK